MNDTIFCDFYKARESESRSYVPVIDINVLFRRMNEIIQEAKKEFVELINVHLFRFAVDHVCRLTRALGRENSHVLLLGEPGSGKKTLTLLSIFIAGMDYLRVQITQKYTINDFVEEIKEIY